MNLNNNPDMQLASQTRGIQDPGGSLSKDLERWSVRRNAWNPPTDVYETEMEIVVRVEIAGMHPSDFKITLDGQTLSIQGFRRDNSVRRAFHQMEIRFGEFQTKLDLPYPVKQDDIEANYSDGFLNVVLPLVAPRRVPIK